ncbi:hypothetical protein [Pandoraea sputorum]|uniref:hypothetical protein n=1 Tax=Pandoraea sputorum TaxID=93222 RepID=UPI003556D76B
MPRGSDVCAIQRSGQAAQRRFAQRAFGERFHGLPGGTVPDLLGQTGQHATAEQGVVVEEAGEPVDDVVVKCAQIVERHTLIGEREKQAERRCGFRRFA